MPLMTVWPVSWSVETRKVGSSWTRRPSAWPIFSWSAFDFGSMASSMTGSGKSIFSRITGLSGSHSVSPVVTLLRPARAMMSPARASFTSSRLLACISSMRPMRSLRSFVLFSTPVADFEHARIDAREGERADERIGHDLEGERRQRRIVARRQRDRLVGAHLHALDVGHVDRRRQVVDDGVEHGLHALVLERRAAQHRNERVGDRALADALDQRVVVGLLAVEVLLDRVVVLLDGHLEQLVRAIRRPAPSGRPGSRRPRTWRPASLPAR